MFALVLPMFEYIFVIIFTDLEKSKYFKIIYMFIIDFIDLFIIIIKKIWYFYIKYFIIDILVFYIKKFIIFLFNYLYKYLIKYSPLFISYYFSYIKPIYDYLYNKQIVKIMNHPLVSFLQNEKVKKYYIFLFNCEKITKYSKWFKCLFNLLILGLIIKDINSNYEFLTSIDKFMDNILSPNFYIMLAYSSIKYYFISKILLIIFNIVTNNSIKEIHDKYFNNILHYYYIILPTLVMLTLFTIYNDDYPLILTLKDLIFYLVIIHLGLGFLIEALYKDIQSPLITLFTILIALSGIIIAIFNIKECLEFMDMFFILKINGNNGPPLGPSGNGNRDPSGPPGSQGPPGPHNPNSHLGQDSSNDRDSSNNRRDSNNRRPNRNREPFNPNRDRINPNRNPFDSYNNRESFDSYNNGYPYNNGSHYDPNNYNNSSNQVIPGPSNSHSGPSYSHSGPSNSEVLNCSSNSGVVTQNDSFERKVGLFDSLGIKKYDTESTVKNKIKKDKERVRLDQLKIDDPAAYKRLMERRSFANRQGSPGTQWGKELEKAKRNETRMNKMRSRSINLNPEGLTTEQLHARMNGQSVMGNVTNNRGCYPQTNWANNNGCYPQTNSTYNNGYYPQTNWANNTNNQSSMPFGNQSRIINEINNNNNRNLNQNNWVNSSNNFDMTNHNNNRVNNYNNYVMTNQNNRANNYNNFDMTNQNNRANNPIHPNINTRSSMDIEMLNRLNRSINPRNNNNGVNNNNSPNSTNRNNTPTSPRQDQN